MTSPQVYGPGDPQPQPTARPAHSKRLVVLALAAGLLLGGGGVGLAWLLTSSEAEGAAADAEAACTVVRRTTDLDPVENVAAYRRWAGAAEIAAAGEADKRYQPLADAVRKPVNILQQMMSTDSQEYTDALSAARQACADL
ncbi:hypothetical protein ABZ863_27340 [Saccharomonospora sp. NPDC046836]|uniref:hypothetical protein n=1 Tax=Saccharomonospora sp. NPDC046836 TaxID=3156921 RepID=UPI0033EAF5F5